VIANVAVIYCADSVREVAEAFGAAAAQVSSLPGPRLRTAHYRGRRLAALAAVLAAERARRARLEL
jgi:hypothetical protein